ncbi:MAG: biotin--[acetyl-CoA-carboxylase] ligase [Fidelibacterota bacterium]
MQTQTIDINTQIIKPEILHFSKIDSTNHYLLKNDLANGTVAMADFQTAGRGRLQRKWEASKSDGLLFSLLINENLDQYHPAAFSFLSAIAVYEGLRNVYYQLPLALKWPNDVICNGKKICGILVESRSSGSGLTKVVIGIGININQDQIFFNREGLTHGTSLKLETGQDGDRIFLLEAILESLEENLLFAKNEEISTILNKWKSYCPYIGKQIKLIENKKEHSGVFEDLDHEGGIILNQEGELNTYYAADVSIDKDSL